MKRISGFTTLELSVAIGFVAIVVGAIISGIDPLERAREARDTRLLNSAGAIFEAMQNYFISTGRLPWVDDFGAQEPAPALSWTSAAAPEVGICEDDTCETPGELIGRRLLTPDFLSRDFIQTERAIDRLYLGKSFDPKSDVFVCFIPSSTILRQDITKLKTVTPGGKIPASGVPQSCPSTTDWQTSYCYLCLPE